MARPDRISWDWLGFKTIWKAFCVYRSQKRELFTVRHKRSAIWFLPSQGKAHSFGICICKRLFKWAQLQPSALIMRLNYIFRICLILNARYDRNAISHRAKIIQFVVVLQRFDELIISSSAWNLILLAWSCQKPSNHPIVSQK